MNQTSMGCHVGKLFRLFSAILLIVLLSACGGGGGSAGSSSGGSSGSGSGSSSGTGSGTSQIPNGKISVELINQSGVADNLISGSHALTAKATVTNNLGAPAAGVVVTFALDSPIAVLSPISGTALTDNSGIAQVSIKAGVGYGAGTMTASATVIGTVKVTDNKTFTVGPPANATPVAVNFISADPSNKSIVIKGAGGNGRTEIAVLTFRVVDNTNAGIPNKTVNFATQSTETVTLVSSAEITDANGDVRATISSGIKPTAVRVVATVNGTSPSISTLSDTVTVTTGLPTQASFNLLREKVNVEGFDFGNIQNKITALLADTSGGVVADGTQIVFTTDSGAIIGDGGSSDTARCLTVNGTCSVTWRSESPNKSVVTVTGTAVSPTAPDNLLKTTIQFTNSASDGTVTGLPASVTFSGSSDAVVGPPAVAAVLGSCGQLPVRPQAFFITIQDRNGYTMPNGTALSAVDALNTAMVIFPASVSAPSAVTAGGTVHEIRISPSSPCPVGLQGHVLLEVKSPLGIAQTYRINVNYQ